MTDRRIREPAHGGRVHSAALTGHPGEYGAQQPQPVPARGAGDHCGAAHRTPASVSTYTHTHTHTLTAAQVTCFSPARTHTQPLNASRYVIKTSSAPDSDI